MFSALFFKVSYVCQFVHACVYERLSIHMGLADLKVTAGKYLIMSKQGIPSKFLTCAFPFAVLYHMHHTATSK